MWLICKPELLLHTGIMVLINFLREHLQLKIFTGATIQHMEIYGWFKTFEILYKITAPNQLAIARYTMDDF